MKRILITGASGYLGSRLSQYFSNKGYHITACMKVKPKNHPDWLVSIDELIIEDITSARFFKKIKNKSFDAAIHLVSLDQIESNLDESLVARINVIPTWKLLNELNKTGLKKFIYFSTFQVYGTELKGAINEKRIPNPVSSYSLTHYLSEEICQYYNRCSPIDCIILRLSNSYGSPVFSNPKCWKLVINDLCKSAFYKSKIDILSDGTPMRDFIHYIDVCSAVGKILQINNYHSNKVYNVGSGSTLSIMEIADVINSVYKKYFNKELPIRINKDQEPRVLKKYEDLDRFKLNIDKLKELGYKSKIPLRNGIEELFKYFEANNLKF